MLTLIRLSFYKSPQREVNQRERIVPSLRGLFETVDRLVGQHDSHARRVIPLSEQINCHLLYVGCQLLLFVIRQLRAFDHDSLLYGVKVFGASARQNPDTAHHVADLAVPLGIAVEPRGQQRYAGANKTRDGGSYQ